MVAVDYTPQRGDIVWLNFNPQVGREQAGRRPAVVLSPGLYNGKVGLLLACPITSQVKGYPFEVAIPAGLKIRGVVLCDQVKSLDWRGGEAEFVGRLPANAMNEVLAKISALL
ncbi:MAG: endoribonuclease MazF [Anaerolineae bacterium]|uniref:endoribonuclease MazF n=1 Tax=Promineifilum sp. TaxID=2664178 RepID=UPI002428EA3B|nr:endoribonuclease MazF [Promineifilum sp.]MCW5846421.1 endoribonuclease MazF [Anaerolineae bacterium]